MALQSSGAISLADLATEFGGTAPHSMSEYYRGGGLVPNNNTGVPTSGVISLSDFYGAVAAIVLDITSNTTNYDIRLFASAAGYNAATDTTPIIVNVAAGVTVSGSSAVAGLYAIRTGALNADSDLTINVAATASVEGFTGATGGYDSVPGEPGGDAIYFETATGGSGVYSVVNSGTVGGGGGGGGGGGQQGLALTAYSTKGGYYCAAPTLTGSSGSPGAAGGLGQAGAAGTAGAFYPPAVAFPDCYTQSPGAGGAGGAAGFAVRKNGRTVSTTGGGSYLGSTA